MNPGTTAFSSIGLLIVAGALLAPLAGVAAKPGAPALKLASLKVVAMGNNVAAYTPPAQPAALEPAPAQPALAEARLESLGMGDMIRITVFRNPDLTTETKVSERGTIMFPMIGEVAVTGFTPAQVRSAIAAKLKAGGYVVNPEVTVSIAQVNSRQVSVLGNVAKPGRYPLDSVNVKLTDVLATAGGVAARARHGPVVSQVDGKSSKVVSISGDVPQRRPSRNIDLKPWRHLYLPGSHGIRLRRSAPRRAYRSSHIPYAGHRLGSASPLAARSAASDHRRGDNGC